VTVTNPTLTKETTEWIESEGQTASPETLEEKLAEVQTIVNPITSKLYESEGPSRRRFKWQKSQTETSDAQKRKAAAAAKARSKLIALAGGASRARPCQ
jgi:hypothetical protein